MIQVVLFLITVGLAAAGFVWFADRPGDVVINWLGYRIETSLMVTLLALILDGALALSVWLSQPGGDRFGRQAGRLPQPLLDDEVALESTNAGTQPGGVRIRYEGD